MNLTDRERAIASAAADEACTKVLKIIGIDPNDINSIEQYYAERQFVKRQKKASESITMYAKFIAVGITLSGLASIIWLGFKAVFAK